MKIIIVEKLILSLFYQIVYMSIIATVVGLVILGIRKITREKISPKYHYIIWFAFLLALVFPVAIPNRISIYNYIDISKIKNRNVTLADTNSNLDGNDEEDFKMLESKVNENKPTVLIKVIAYIWFVICVAKLIQIIISSQILKTKIGDYEIRDERMIKILEKCKKRLKIDKEIKMIKQDFVKTPAVVGVFYVRILFTEAALKLDDISITDIIMHELSHYKRKDAIFNMFGMVMKAIYWFNPVIRIIFKYVKNDMEFATDQMAINHLEEEEKNKYCRSILKVIQISNFIEEPVLGMSSYVKDLEERIDMIALVDEFEEHTKRIAILSTAIIILIWLLLYPTSYGMFGTPKLYLEFENGDKVEATIVDGEESSPINAIVVKENDKLKLLTENKKNNDYIACDIVFLKGNDSGENTRNILKDSLSEFEHGEYIYKFTLKRSNNKVITYEIKVVVE